VISWFQSLRFQMQLVPPYVVEAVWGIFDPDGSGAIDRQEFLMPDGLAETIVASAGNMAR
jgi:hypothetical protein